MFTVIALQNLLKERGKIENVCNAAVSAVVGMRWKFPFTVFHFSTVQNKTTPVAKRIRTRDDSDEDDENFSHPFPAPTTPSTRWNRKTLESFMDVIFHWCINIFCVVSLCVLLFFYRKNEIFVLSSTRRHSLSVVVIVMRWKSFFVFDSNSTEM